ncbi:MAG: MerR family transcriptional regulator [Candidatus Omnitrophota bacterium]
MQESPNLIFAKEIAMKFNIPYPTVNHYTNLGLLNVVKRKGNRRLYEERKVRAQLEDIFKLSGEGYPLRLICKKLR